MAQNKPVRVKPNVLQSFVNRLYTTKPIEGATKPAELSWATTNKDMVKLMLNFKRTEQDKADAEMTPRDAYILLNHIVKLASDENTEDVADTGVALQVLSHFAGGNYSPDPLPIGTVAVGRTKGVIWIGFFCKSRPPVKWPILTSKLSRLQTLTGEELSRAESSALAAKAYGEDIPHLLRNALADRHIPWQHQNIIKEGKESPYSDRNLNPAYFPTFNPNGGGNGGNSGGGNSGYQQSAGGGSSMDFDDDIPL